MAASPDAVVGLENLKDFVVTNAELIEPAQENANILCAELEVLKHFITRCMEQRYKNDGFLSGLSKRFRTLVCRAEDTIGNYIVTVSKQKLRGAVSAAFHTIDHAMELRNISRELDALTREVNSTYEKAVKDEGVMQLVNSETSNTNEGIRRKHPVDDDMVGFMDAMDAVVNYLNKGKDDLHTVSIYGMFGLGKTTLARQVFKHPTVEYQFFIRAFVEVSQEFKRREVLVKLVCALGNVSPEEMNRMDEDDLEEAIREYLERRNYLIVLDDVWTKVAWDNLKRCFPNNNKGSRVLITTRNLDVAQHAMQGSNKIEPYKLRFLNPFESEQLLRKRVFGTEEGINKPELNIHEEAILAMCNGLPSAIVVVAGILKNNPNESFWWESVSKMGSDVLAKEACYSAIRMSFDHLPYLLKPCFLYLGVFREDSEIIAKTLYQLWVSEGFVPPGDSNETSEDIAEIFLEQLAERSLVMVKKRKLNGRIKTVRIHDALRGFCKLMSIEGGLFREIKYREETPMASQDHDRRLCIHSHVLEYITNTNKQTGKYVRSFLSFAEEDFVLPFEYISEIPKAFKLLRVLDVRSIRFTRIPTELFYSFLLKYLAMCSDLKTIPEVVSNLRYLQTFIFHTTQGSIEIKADIWKMKHLRHLQTNATTSLVKSKEVVCNNLNLQTLSKIAPECCTLDVFKRAENLKKLAVSGELAPYMDTLFHLLTELTLLENLKLLNAKGSPPLNCLPSKSSFPRKITRLTLQNTKLSWDSMSRLVKLEQLEVLKLKENAFVGAYWDIKNSDGSFVALKVLHIGNTDLTAWKASKDHFPLLKQLYLKHCTRLKSMPSDLVNIETLNLIDIYCCNSDVADSARKLVLAKLQVQNQESIENTTGKKNKSTKLKLFIYPPEY